MNIYKANFAKQILIPVKTMAAVVYIMRGVIFTFIIVGDCDISSVCFFVTGALKCVAAKISKLQLLSFQGTHLLAKSFGFRSSSRTSRYK